jgi:hypothetical protein
MTHHNRYQHNNTHARTQTFKIEGRTLLRMQQINDFIASCVLIIAYGSYGRMILTLFRLPLSFRLAIIHAVVPIVETNPESGTRELATRSLESTSI